MSANGHRARIGQSQETMGNDHKQMMLHLSKPSPRGGIEALPIDEELLLYVSAPEKAVALSPSARIIWELCDGKRTIQDIAIEIGRQLPCEDQQIIGQLDEDIQTTICELVQQDLLVLNNACP